MPEKSPQIALDAPARGDRAQARWRSELTRCLGFLAQWLGWRGTAWGATAGTGAVISGAKVLRL